MPADQTEMIATIKVDLSKYVKETLTNDEGLSQWVQEYSPYRTLAGVKVDSSYWKEQIDAIQAAFNNGRKVVVFRVSNENDDPIETMLHDQGLSQMFETKDMEVIGDML